MKVRSNGQLWLRILVLVTLGGCAHSEFKGPEGKWHAVEIDKTVELKLKGVVGRKEQVRYASRSVAEVYEDGNLLNAKEHGVDFLAETNTQTTEANRFNQTVVTADKDGVLDLHDFAMPEVGEKLDVVISDQGKILKAGSYPTSSLFYVPPVSLPKDPVKTGDTWAMTAQWVTESGVPLKLEMVSILKGFFDCGEHDQCADLEISGEVLLDGPLAGGGGFKNRWQGRQLFAVNAGTTAWSEIQSREVLDSDNVHRVTRTCMVGQMVEPKLYKMVSSDKPNCTVPDKATLAP